ncbi:MAG TPA: hypothetical protein VGT60_06510 [Candidatus Limnocylindria bacterium]|nr:hypothetical protein [Candidatus Limnocylindria bacterium]
MTRLIALAVVLLSLATSGSASAWNPYRDLDIDRPPPPVWTPEPAPVAPPPGIYLVTETYAGDSISRAGAVTTYSTETVHQVTGSYARVLENVGTGGSSAYDGAAFNGRASLGDGRSVAGTYYENFIRSGEAFIPVSVVFFQDDREVAHAVTAPRPQPVVAPAREPGPAPAPVPGPAPAAPAGPVVIERDVPVPVAPARPAVRPSALLADRSIEVLRARRTSLSFSAADVRGWRFVSGDCVSLGGLSGTAADPFVARWDRPAPIGTTRVMRFLIDYADGTSHELVVRVAVRAPGLVE